ncbi:MAG: malonyl CoA-acyl carrier protein transacylase, partial [Sphingomonadaceae bacterium]
ANVTAAPAHDPDAIRALLVEQVTHMVRWRESVAEMVRLGTGRFVEFGGRVLAPIVKRIAPDAEALSIVEMKDVEAALKAL